MSVNAALVLAVVLGCSACTHGHAGSASPRSLPDSRTDYIIVQGAVGGGKGVHPETVLRSLSGKYSECREWLINGRAAGPVMTWELHLETSHAPTLEAAAQQFPGVTALTVGKAGRFASAPLGSSDVAEARPCAFYA